MKQRESANSGKLEPVHPIWKNLCQSFLVHYATNNQIRAKISLISYQRTHSSNSTAVTWFNDQDAFRNDWGTPVRFVSFSDHQPASVAQLDAPSDWRPGGRGFNPRRGRQHSFVEIDHEIFSAAILSLPLIQEGQLSVSGERMRTILVNRLED